MFVFVKGGGVAVLSICISSIFLLHTLILHTQCEVAQFNGLKPFNIAWKKIKGQHKIIFLVSVQEVVFVNFHNTDFAKCV